MTAATGWRILGAGVGGILGATGIFTEKLRP
jgi:hypothetical protein